MVETKDEIRKTLNLLRHVIREQEWTQRRVQYMMGWGTTYISQIFRGQKAVRITQILSILEAIGVEPKEFYQELYRPPDQKLSKSLVINESAVNEDLPGGQGQNDLLSELNVCLFVANELIRILISKGTISGEDLVGVLGNDERKTDSFAS